MYTTHIYKNGISDHTFHIKCCYTSNTKDKLYDCENLKINITSLFVTRVFIFNIVLMHV